LHPEIESGPAKVQSGEAHCESLIAEGDLLHDLIRGGRKKGGEKTEQKAESE
tara:strand:- start:310 stop:465 length:156 start_codon:yes stop_codon:yes gene_type:complete